MPDYANFVPRQRFQPVLALSPDGRTVAYSSDTDGNFNLWTSSVAGGQPRQMTKFNDRSVRQIAWSPDGKSLVFTADRHGDEQYRLYRADLGDELEDEEPVELSPGPDCQRVLANAPFDANGRYLAYAANDREATVQDLLIRDLAEDTERRVIPPAGEAIFEPVAVSPDGRWLLVSAFRSKSEINAYLLDLSDAEAELECVTGQYGQHAFEACAWSADSSGFYLLTDLWGEFIAAAHYSLDDSSLSPVARHEWDVELVQSAGQTVIWSVNEGGYSRLHGQRHDQALTFPDIPPGVISAITLSPGTDQAVVLIDSATRPTEIGVVTPGEGFRYLTDTRPSALHVVEPVQPEMVTYAASDGRSVHAFLYRPHTPGPHPVLMSIHGGPENQERPGYARSGLYQHLLDEGIAVFAPNIAGSTGYGTAHQLLIRRDWGGVDLDDLARGVDYLQDVPGIDADRIAAMGGSYGGFATLSCLARLPFRWAAGVSICGPTNLVTLAEACPPTWKAFVALVLGDPVEDAEHLTSRSPLTHAEGITAPLFILQGARDPRVPRAESDQMVGSLRGRGVDVQYEVFEDEGHGFTNRSNELRAYEQVASFLKLYLLEKTQHAGA
ncbi:S9 family peptidase [Actinomadura adrarensis]|uniref:S9 family peptidase n=1 Tax=Actinomadura adrarensis TaxID=1819600 RepID=A0ABW3CUS4_9ACTN